MIKFFRASAITSEGQSQTPGSIVNITKNELWLACDPGIISILELQLEGHKRMGVEGFLRGHHLKIGEVFN